MSSIVFLSLLALAPLQTPAPASPTPAATQKPSVPKSDTETKLDGKAIAGAFRLRSIGPAVTSGRVVGFAVDPKNHAKYYVAVASGGVWKTINNGTTWQPVFDGEASYSIGCITMDPKNPDTLWVGTGENNSQRSVAYGDGVYKSTDGGRSWTNVGLKTSEHIGKILIDPRDSNTVYVAAQGPLWGPGGERGLYKTTDGGANWTQILKIDENTGVTDFLLDPTNPDTILAASYQRRRRVWTLINGGPGSAIHRSTDAGKTWKKVSGGLPGGELGRIGLALAPSSPNVVYSIIEGNDRSGGIYRSTNFGVSWDKQNPFDQQGQYYSHLVVDPVNKDRLYVMSVIIQVSDDGGRTLTSMPGGSKHVDNHEIWIDPNNPDYYLVGCDGGIYESFDRAATWHFKSNLPVAQFYDIAVDQNPASGPFYNVYGGTQDNYTLGGPVRTRDSHGATNADWFVVQGGDGFHCQVDPTDPNTIYAEYQNGGLCRFDVKTGNRIDIQPAAAPGEPPLRWNWDSPLLLSHHDSKRLYYAANKLFRSNDRGSSWTAISPDLSKQIDRDTLPVMGKVWGPDAISKHVSTSFYGNIVAIAESRKKAGLLYIGTDDGLIQVSPDDGKNWTKISTIEGVPEGTYVSKLLTSLHDADTIYAAFDSHKNADFKPYLLKSTDAGKTWKSVAGDLPPRGTVYSVAEDHVNPQLLFCGTEFGLFMTIDGGQKWHRMKNGLPTIQVKDLVIQRANDDLVVGTFGRGIYVLDDYSSLRDLTAENLAKKSFLSSTSGAMVYIPASPLGGGPKGFQGASLYTASNPAFGATFTYTLTDSPMSLKAKRSAAEKELEAAKKPIPYPTGEQLRAEADEEGSSVQLVIRDFNNDILRTTSVPSSTGIHRFTWDLRENGISSSGSDDEAGGGPMVMPGRYRATLVRRTPKTTETLAGPIEFSLRPDPLSSLKPEDYVTITTYNRKAQSLAKAMTSLSGSFGEAIAKAETMRRVFDQTATATDADRAAIRKTLDTLKAMQLRISGDRFLSSRNIITPTTLNDRVGNARRITGQAVSLPTGTQLAEYDAAKELMTKEVMSLRTVLEQDLPTYTKRLDDLGATWTPGRLPTIPK